MIKPKIVPAICMTMLSAISNTAHAHHSFGAIFQENAERQVSGVLTKVEWINPHSYFYVDVTNSDGSITSWSFENFPPGMLRRMGLERATLMGKIGSKVKVSYYPARTEGKSVGYGRVFDFEGGPRIVFTAPSADGSTP